MYAYDAAQRLTSITPPGQSATSFTLDALGRPATRGSDTYSYVGTSETAWRISDGAGATVSAIDADGGRASVASSSDFGWLLGDLHGNVAVALNQAETAVSSALRYDGYGQTLDSYAAGTLPTPWRYQGRLDVSPDADNPLYDAGARFYSPAIGAFTQLDTVSGSAQDPWSMNRYLYAGANPTSMIDPDGHMFIQGPQADLGGNSYHVKPIQHNVPKGSSYEPIQRKTVYIAPPKKTSPKPAAAKPASTGGGFDLGGAANTVVHRTGNVAWAAGSGLVETGGGFVGFGGEVVCQLNPWCETSSERYFRAILEGDTEYLNSLPTLGEQVTGAADAFVKAGADLSGENGPDAQDSALGHVLSFSAITALPVNLRVFGATERSGGIVFRSDTTHIFRNAVGHLADDTAENRALLRGAIKPTNVVQEVPIPNGVITVYRETLADGRQVWVNVRNGIEITNGGVNGTAR